MTGRTRADARDAVRGLTAYDEQAGTGLNLKNNTNLFGPNPALQRAVASARVDAFWDYPSLASDRLREAIAAKHGVPVECIVTGNGSNDLIDILVRTFTDTGERVAFHPPTFGMIPFFTRAHGADAVPVPLVDPESPEGAKAPWGLPTDALVAADAKLTFICSPNNPTGNAFPRRDVERVAREASGLVVVDEAYGEFAEGASFARDVPGSDNVVVLRTFSKGYGLAGLRVGYAIAPGTVARDLSKVRGPFRLNAFSEAAAVLAVEESAWLEQVVSDVARERARLTRNLEARGFRVFPSDANFVLSRPPVDAPALARALAARGVHVRDFKGEMAPYMRMTVGPEDAMNKLDDALDAALAEVTP